MALPQTLLSGLLVVGLTGAVVVDIRSRRIPNAITLPVALAGLALNVWAAGWTGLGHSVGGLLLGMCLLAPIWLSGGTGAGDVKLLGMVGALCGPLYALWTALFGAVAGGLLALLALAWRGGGREVLGNVQASLFRMVVLRVPGAVQPTSRSFRMSYALAIALGAAAAGWYL